MSEIAHPIAWHPVFENYGLDAESRPVSVPRRGTSGRRPIATHRRWNHRWFSIRWRKRTLTYRLDRFAAECRGVAS